MGTIPASDNVFDHIKMAEGAAPSTPPSGQVIVYPKSDGLLYWKDDAGTEYPVGVAVAALDDLSDVNAPSPTDGDVLTWDSTPGEWIASAASGGVATLDDVGDVNAPTPSDGDVLTWDSTPGEWVSAAPAAGGGGALTFISETVLGSAAAQIDITGIPTGYRDLVIVGRFRSATASTKVLRMLMGDSSAIDTGNNYSYNRNYNGTLANGSSQTAGVGYIEAGAFPGSGSTAGYFGAGRWELIDYASTSRSRIVLGGSFDDANDGNFMTTIGGMWRNVSAAVARIRVVAGDASNFDTGSALAVYGRG